MKILHMEFQLKVLKKNRIAILRLINGFSMDQLNKIPEGFNNNLVWNIAHLLVTQQILCYKLAGLPMYVKDDLVSRFMKGTAPEKEVTLEEFEVIKTLLTELPQKLEEDLHKGIFKPFNGYTTSLNVTLTDINSSIEFNNFHEGIHLGVIMSLRKLV